MKTITIPEGEYFDEKTEKFITVKETVLTLEHSLVSISKWESKWKKPFVSNADRSIDELRDYIRCMTLTQNVDPKVYKIIPASIIDDVIRYMNDPMTATWFSDSSNKTKRNGEVVTSELVYYWMTAMNIPIECQKWHFNRLMTLIRIASEKNQPPKKMSKNDILRQNKSLNAMRRAKARSRG